VSASWPLGGLRQQGAKGRLIFALDVASVKEAEQYVRLLVRDVGLFKIGKQLFLHAGPKIVSMVREKGGEVFLDLKFHDIPRTVAKAAAEATRMGARMVDLHASGSSAMMQQTVSEVNRVCRNEGLRRPKILAVTVLTSLTREDLRKVGVAAGVENQVVRLARLAREASMDGVVASPLEIARIRKEWDDQKRVLSPADAIQAGADYLVVGKPIRDAQDPRAAAREIVAEMERGGARPVSGLRG
jgi:orotidine-5'-phosphate decarboxylase